MKSDEKTAITESRGGKAFPNREGRLILRCQFLTVKDQNRGVPDGKPLFFDARNTPLRHDAYSFPMIQQAVRAGSSLMSAQQAL